MAVTTRSLGGDAPGAVKRREALTAVWHLLSRVILVGVYLAFAIAHLRHWSKTGDLSGLGLVVTEGVFAGLFLVRRLPKRSSSAPLDWAVALGGSWLAAFVRPGAHPLLGLDVAYSALQVAGTAVSVLALFSLGRSFGVVAADRGIKTGGLYGFVRHPVYASYMVTQFGYVLQNPSPLNLGIILAASACQIGRVRAEERVLAGDPEWVEYARRVRYRLAPGIY